MEEYKQDSVLGTATKLQREKAAIDQVTEEIRSIITVLADQINSLGEKLVPVLSQGGGAETRLLGQNASDLGSSQHYMTLAEQVDRLRNLAERVNAIKSMVEL